MQEVPKTGDSNRTGVYAWVSVLSAAGIGAALVLRKKKRS
ncbi:MAG: LPXTG cell wall anchor domain-containing protein [Clostridiales bacterium]|nr:LPXTG cell wall anchor domain-containing protein [Clostridiales bacterium]MDU0939102.1 LPXTG cell wall anchor domain-containing protein [Clostridiales bacterium]